MGKKIQKHRKINQQQTELYDKITKIEQDILKRIAKLKNQTKFSYCQHVVIQNPTVQPYDQNINYYDAFWKRFLMNEVGKGEIIKIRRQIDHFSSRLQKIQLLFEKRKEVLQPFQHSKTKKPKIQQQQAYICGLCNRNYSDSEALILHQQVKHPQSDLIEIYNKQSSEIYQDEENQAHQLHQ